MESIGNPEWHHDISRTLSNVQCSRCGNMIAARGKVGEPRQNYGFPAHYCSNLNSIKNISKSSNLVDPGQLAAANEVWFGAEILRVWKVGNMISWREKYCFPVKERKVIVAELGQTLHCCRYRTASLPPFFRHETLFGDPWPTPFAVWLQQYLLQK